MVFLQLHLLLPALTLLALPLLKPLALLLLPPLLLSLLLLLPMLLLLPLRRQRRRPTDKGLACYSLHFKGGRILRMADARRRCQLRAHHGRVIAMKRAQGGWVCMLAGRGEQRHENGQIGDVAAAGMGRRAAMQRCAAKDGGFDRWLHGRRRRGR